jgi:glutathione S-transferase
MSAIVSQWPEILHGAVYSALAVFLLTWVGNKACRKLLDATGLTEAMQAKKDAAKAESVARAQAANQPPPADPPDVGGVIGAFERSLLAIGLLTASWEVLAGVVALKTVARFKELDERLDAEYFLVGSLFSIAWAIAVSSLWLAYDQALGHHLSVGIAEAAKAIKGD